MNEQPVPTLDQSMNTARVNEALQQPERPGQSREGSDLSKVSSALLSRKINAIRERLSKEDPAQQTETLKDPHIKAMRELAKLANLDAYDEKKNPGGVDAAHPLDMSAGRQMKVTLADGREVNVLQITAVSGDVFTINYKYISPQGTGGEVMGTATVDRRQIIVAQMKLKQAEIAAGYTPAEQQTVNLHIKSLQKDGSVAIDPADKATAKSTVENQARSNGQLLVSDLREGMAKAASGGSEPVDPAKAHMDWEARKAAAGGAFDATKDPEPAQPDKTALDAYAQQQADWARGQTELQAKMARFDRTFDGQILADPEAAVKFIQSEMGAGEKTALTGELEIAQKNIDTLTQQLADTDAQLAGGGAKFTPDGTPIPEPDKAALKVRQKQLQMQLDFAKKYKAALEKMNGGNGDNPLTVLMTKLQDGDLDQGTAADMCKALRSGDPQALVDQVNSELKKKMQETGKALSAEETEALQSMYKHLERIKTLKGVGKTVAIGVLALIAAGVLSGSSGMMHG